MNKEKNNIYYHEEKDTLMRINTKILTDLEHDNTN